MFPFIYQVFTVIMCHGKNKIWNVFRALKRKVAIWGEEQEIPTEGTRYFKGKEEKGRNENIQSMISIANKLSLRLKKEANLSFVSQSNQA